MDDEAYELRLPYYMELRIKSPSCDYDKHTNAIVDRREHRKSAANKRARPPIQ
jgi:hypothetical protein